MQTALKMCLNLTARSSPADTGTIPLNGYWSMMLEKLDRILIPSVNEYQAEQRLAVNRANAKVTVRFIQTVIGEINEKPDLIIGSTLWPEVFKTELTRQVRDMLDLPVQYL